MKQKVGSLKKINKRLVRLTKKGKTQITKIRKGSRDVTTNSTQIK